MNERVKLLGTILVSLLLLSIAIYSTYRHYTYQTIHADIVLGKNGVSDGLTAHLKLTASYDIKVYRNGELVATRHKDNDPISINWYKLLANFLLLGTDSGQLFTWYDTSYNTHTAIDTEQDTASYTVFETWSYGFFNPKMYIVLGNGTGTPSLYDYKLFNQVMSDKASMTVQDDTVNQRFIITYTRTFLIKQQFTLAEVGLELQVDVNTGNSRTLANVLVCHDTVQPSITLYPNDAVSVTYRVEMPYSNAGVFTEWFYDAIIDYMLGYKGTTGNSLTLKFTSGNTGVIDTGTDGPRGYDDVDDYVHVNVGTGKATANPLWQVYNLGNNVASESITDTSHFTTIKDTSGNLTITYVVVYTFTSAENISEIGLLLHTDRDGSPGNYIADSLLLAYWVLPNPVDVSAYSGLRVEITVTIPYS